MFTEWVRGAASTKLRVTVLLIAATALVAAAEPAPAASALDDGILAYEAGRYTEALPLLERAVKQQPKNARAWTWLGATLLKLGRVSDAITALTRATALDPRSQPAHFFLGIAHARVGDTQKARAAFEKVRALGPETPYGFSAGEWLATLAGGGSAPPPPAPPVRVSPPPPAPGPPAGGTRPVAPAPAGACPRPPELPAPTAPAAPKVTAAAVEIADWEFAVQNAELQIQVDVENLTESAVQNVRVQATGFTLDGRPGPRAVANVGGRIESDDSVQTSLVLATSPPVFWVQLEIVEYGGRKPTDSLHAVMGQVEPQEYQALARARIRPSVSVLPAAISPAHTLCVFIADAGGFPIQSVRTRVSLQGSGSGRNIQQVKIIDVAARGGTTRLEWPVPLRVTARAEVEEVQFAPLPAPKRD